MHTIISTLSPISRNRLPAAPSSDAYRQPNYDCRDQPAAVKVVVYVPGVEATGVNIEARGPDLIITAHKAHFVRVNWTALHLERAQRDYQLRLRLGAGFDYAALRAVIRRGVLTVTLPKRPPHLAAAGDRVRQFA